MRAKRHVLAQALRIAAEEYERCQATANSAVAEAEPKSHAEAAHARLARGFEAQAKEARELADQIEGTYGSALVLTD